MSIDHAADENVRPLCETRCHCDETCEHKEAGGSSHPDPATDWQRLVLPSLRRILRWRVPPNWSQGAWKEEVYALAMASGWLALRDFDPSRGVPIEAFVYQRVIARAYSRYRQEWAFASRQSHDHDAILEAAHEHQLGPYPQVDDRIEAGIERLCECDRTLLRMLFWDGFSQHSAADRLGITQQAVSKRLKKALLQLRDTIDTARAGSMSSVDRSFGKNGDGRL